MALNGIKALKDKIDDFKKSYSEFRINLYKEAYPKYNKDPRSVDASLRNELCYFLKKLNELSYEIDGSKNNSLDTMLELIMINPILPALNESMIQNQEKASNMDVNEEVQEVQELQFALEM